MGSSGRESTVKAIWRECDCVCFDVDSTVVVDEGIDELAAFLGVGSEVAKLTTNAMTGSMTYKESLTKRLDIMHPTLQEVQRFIAAHPPRLSSGMQELMTLLQSQHVPIYLISGGFQSIIEPIAETLRIPKQNIYANKLLFSEKGSYAGFDETCPTCETGGKPKVIQQLKDLHCYKRLVHIGDGITDMEACPPADAFIGFGGNQVREKVKTGADWYVTSFQELIEEMNNRETS